MARTDYHEKVDIGLSLLREGLLPFVEQCMKKHYGSEWLSQPEVESIIRKGKRKKEKKPHLDTYALLKIIGHNSLWDAVFKDNLDWEIRSIVYEVQNIRNNAKHDEEFNNDDAFRALDSIARLLKKVSPETEKVAEVEKMRDEVLRERFEDEEKATVATQSAVRTVSQPAPVENPIPNEYMSRSQQIEEIIKQRQPLVAKIKAVESNLNSLADDLEGLERRRMHLVGKLNDQNISDRLNSINFSAVRYAVSRERDDLEKLRKRLSRDTLNIGVVGLMGQGKSTWLQSISGLTNEVIPALRGGACTAVRSTICYQEGETYAEVTVHSEDSFLKEVISPYYLELGLGAEPKTLSDFAQPLPEFSARDATLASMYEHLKGDYHENLQQYRDLLKSGAPRKLPPVPQGEIEQYVSQRRNERGDLISFVHLAVREVKIFCRFPNQEVGQIALVDVPGLGDTRLGDEQLILETLGQEVDLVLFVRRPDRLRYGWEKRDTDLYKTAYQALNKLEKRAFMILNRVTGSDDNMEACQKHQATLGDKHINVVSCEIVDCSNSEQANQFLDKVLDYLADNITGLDDEYARGYQERLQKLQRDVNAELDKARQDWTAGLSPDDFNEYEKFGRLFKELWRNLTRGLEELLDEFDWEQKPEEEDQFKQQVALVIENCKNDAGLPQIDEIINLRFELGDWQQAYARYLHDVRTHLTRHFESMNNGLQNYVEQAKSQVSEVLVEKAHLGNLTNARGPEFLKIMAEVIPDRLLRLKQAFQTLSEFEMTYRSNFRYLIRPHLNTLNPNKADLRLKPVTGVENRQEKAKEILDYLETLQEEAVFRCETALADLYSEPVKAVFIEVEEFVDQVLRARNVEEDWRNYIFQEKAQIWPAEFGGGEEGNDRQEWLNLVEQAASANQPMQFLN